MRTIFIAALIALLSLIAAYNHRLIGYYSSDINGGVFIGDDWCGITLEFYNSDAPAPSLTGDCYPYFDF